MPTLPFTNESFYEVAWRARLELIERWCAEPGANPWRVINRLALHELDHRLGIVSVTAKATGASAYTGNYGWLPKGGDPAATLPTGVPPFTEVALRDRDAMVPSYADLAIIPARWVAHHCQTHEYDAIVELGSGFGRNLFALYYLGGPRIPYFACEYTESGRRMTEMLAALDRSIPLSVLPFDHKAPDLAFLAGRERVLLLTIHSIEQVKHLPDDYFDRLAGAAPAVTAMHFEPFGHQLGRDNAISNRQRDHVAKQGWNLDLLEKLREADKRGVIRLSFLADNLWSTTLENPTSVAIWTNAPATRR